MKSKYESKYEHYYLCHDYESGIDDTTEFKANISSYYMTQFYLMMKRTLLQ